MSFSAVLSWSIVVLSLTLFSYSGEEESGSDGVLPNKVVVEHTYNDIMSLSRIHIQRAGYNLTDWKNPMLCYVPKSREWRVTFNHVGDEGVRLKLVISDGASELNGPPTIIGSRDRDGACGE